MYFDYTPEQKALRDELRAYFTKLIDDELLAELVELLRQLGAVLLGPPLAVLQ